MRTRRRRIPDGLLRAASLALLALPCGSVAGADLRVGAGVDVVHKQSMAVASLRYGAVTALAWDNDNYGAGLTYEVGPMRGWEAGIGAFLAARTDGNLGTQLNALVRLAYCHGHVCLSGIHISHGSTFGIERDKANSGLNFLLLEFR